MTDPATPAQAGATDPVRNGSWQLAGAVGVTAGAGRQLLGPLDLRVRSGVIESVVAARGGGGQRRDPRLLVLVPLLVNAHDHGRGTGNVIAGIPDAPLEPWIESLRAHAGRTTQASLVGDGCRAMLGSGIGGTVICVNAQSTDTAGEVAAATEAALETGIRAAVVYPIADAMGALYGRDRDAPGWPPAEVKRRLDQVEGLADAFDVDRVELQLGPVGPQWVSESTLAAIGKAAQRRSRRVHLHLLESRMQRAWADRVYPEGLIELLRRVELLGPHVCVAHGTQLRPDELAALAEAGCVLSLNASSNLRLASGIAPVAAALGSPIALGAGLDGLALGDDADYWNELRLVRGIAQAQSGERVVAEALLERLTAGGRRALGSCAPEAPKVGRLADFCLLDLQGYEHLLERDHGNWPSAEVVLAAGTPERVREVWVAGRRVLERAAAGHDAYAAAMPSQPGSDR